MVYFKLFREHYLKNLKTIKKQTKIKTNKLYKNKYKNKEK